MSHRQAATSAAAMVMSAQELHTWAVASQSYRNPNTYSPAGVSAGTVSVSIMETPIGNLPEQLPLSSFREASASPHGGANCIGVEAVPKGSGFTAHMDPGGVVPVVRYRLAIESLVPAGTVPAQKVAAIIDVIRAWVEMRWACHSCCWADMRWACHSCCWEIHNQSYVCCRSRTSCDPIAFLKTHNPLISFPKCRPQHNTQHTVAKLQRRLPCKREWVLLEASLRDVVRV
jgi:hypothetical protein